MRCGTGPSGSGHDRFGGGTQGVLVSWAFFGGLLLLAGALSTLDAETLGTAGLGIANAAAGLWLHRRVRPKRVRPKRD
ncbi:MAG: hypothetical protein AAGF47_10980 [Planctomycetota bacterium]